MRSGLAEEVSENKNDGNYLFLQYMNSNFSIVTTDISQ